LLSSYVLLSAFAIHWDPLFLENHAAYAQTPLKSTTSGGSLDVMLEPSKTSIDTNGQTSFKVAFLKPKTNPPQVHIDYDFTIEKDGKTVYRAAEHTGQQPAPPYLHTAEGIVTIPYKFEQNGSYTVKVTLYGINFVPLKPETAVFPIQVTPEFPTGIASVLVAAILGVALISKGPYLRRFSWKR